MKLLFFIHSLTGGGAERVLVLLTRGLSEKGHDVTVVTRVENNAYTLAENVKLVEHKSLFSYNTRNIFIKFIRKIIHPFYHYWFDKKVVNAVNPNAVITFMGMDLAQLLIICRNKYPIIASEHTTFERIVSRRMQFYRDYLLKYTDLITILTQSDYNYLGDRFPQKVVMPNPVTFPVMSFDEYSFTFSLRRDVIACGSVSRYKVKGFDNLLKSFAIVVEKHPDWHLNIVGDGDKESLNYLMSIVKEKKIDNNVHFLGFCKNVDEIMKRHAIFVLSSRNEGFPMTLAEAMSCGCACVSYNVKTGPNEIIIDGEDGLLVENQNIEKLALGMNRLIEDEELRFNYGKNAISNINRFSLDKIISKWEMIISNVKEKYKN